MSSNHPITEHPGRHLEPIVDRCMARFRIPNDRSLIAALQQPDQISNRSALIRWIGEQLQDPEVAAEENLYQVMSERLALLLVDRYPHRWTEIVGDVMREDPLPSFAFLDALRRRVSGVSS